MYLETLYKLDIINAAQTLDDLKSPPGNRLEPLEITQKALAEHLSVPVQRINEIAHGKRGITPDTAWLLSEALNTSPEFWLNLQSTHDLSAHRPKHRIQSMVVAAG